MRGLPRHSLKTIAAWYRNSYGLEPRPVRPSGGVDEVSHVSPLDRLRAIQEARRYALEEGVRWGEPYTFFLVPGIISWVVPVVDGYTVVGGVLGGEVLADSDEKEHAGIAKHLMRHGAKAADAQTYLSRLPRWPQVRCQQAAEQLHEAVYQVTGFAPRLLIENRERHQQQREIAEEIHRRKRNDGAAPAVEDRRLLSLIRAGDHRGARSILNQMLGRVLFQSASLTVIRALLIEMMGYLVRRAVEDTPELEPIMTSNHQWMAKIIEAESFESLAAIVHLALDDFMKNVYEMGSGYSDPRVNHIMKYLAKHYREPITLADIAEHSGVGRFRIAHLIKEETGKSLITHVHFFRLQEAKRLLEDTDMACADIAFEVGFCDQSYFTKLFRQQIGMTPGRYRRAMRSGEPILSWSAPD